MPADIFSSPEPKARWAIAIAFRPSSVVRRASCVNFLHFHLLLQNRWADFNQTWWGSSFGGRDPNFFMGSMSLIQIFICFVQSCLTSLQLACLTSLLQSCLTCLWLACFVPKMQMSCMICKWEITCLILPQTSLPQATELAWQWACN